MSMALDIETLIEYRNLHQDLLSLSDGRLSNHQRLWKEIESKIDNFKELLAKKSRNAESRQQLLASGKSTRAIFFRCYTIDVIYL